MGTMQTAALPTQVWLRDFFFSPVQGCPGMSRDVKGCQGMSRDVQGLKNVKDLHETGRTITKLSKSRLQTWKLLIFLDEPAIQWTHH